MRPRVGSGSGGGGAGSGAGLGAAKPAGHSTSFVQSAIYREQPSRPTGGTTSNTSDPIKRSSKTSIYDIIKADISQRKGGVHHHVTDTYHDVADHDVADDVMGSPPRGEEEEEAQGSPAPGQLLSTTNP